MKNKTLEKNISFNERLWCTINKYWEVFWWQPKNSKSRRMKSERYSQMEWYFMMEYWHYFLLYTLSSGRTLMFAETFPRSRVVSLYCVHLWKGIVRFDYFRRKSSVDWVRFELWQVIFNFDNDLFVFRRSADAFRIALKK